jgi:hypothetical protein
MSAEFRTSIGVVRLLFADFNLETTLKKPSIINLKVWTFILTLHCMNFQKHDKKKFHLIKYIQKHNKYYTKITLLAVFGILMKICVCITYDTSWLLSTFTLHIWICITYDTSCLLTTTQFRPLQCIISVTPQQ